MLKGSLLSSGIPYFRRIDLFFVLQERMTSDGSVDSPYVALLPQVPYPNLQEISNEGQNHAKDRESGQIHQKFEETPLLVKNRHLLIAEEIFYVIVQATPDHICDRGLNRDVVV